MIKRPGTENYLQKLIEEERKAYLEVLSVDSNEYIDHGAESSEDEDEENGLIMITKSVH